MISLQEVCVQKETGHFRRPARRSNVHANAANSTAPAMIPSARQILLVDDSHDDAEFFQRALQKLGFQNPFQVLYHGDEAINYFRGEGQFADRKKYPVPYLLLLDPNMPGKSGWEILRWLRQRPEFNTLVVIIFGGAGSPAEREMATQYGANAYHTKPSTTGELEKLVTQIGDFWLAGGALG